MTRGGAPAHHRHVRTREGYSRGAHAMSAQRQLAAYIVATRHARRQRSLALATSILSVLVLLTAGSGWLLADYVSGRLGRVNAGTSGAPASGPLNILLAGVDVRSGLTARQQRILHVGHATGHNSDTLMIVHITADRRHIEVVSLPRDSWVRIPGFGMNKINAAFGLGGPALMVRTVEQATGLTVNDFVEVNFLGFVKIIDALGGVSICLPVAVDDPYSGLHMPAGRHHVSGITALKFARDRHSFPLSDLTRIGDQQQLLASALTEAISSGTLTDPVRLARFLDAATSATTVDRHLSVTALAGQLRYIRPADVTFTAVPLANTSYLTPTGQSAVLWKASAAQALFSQVRSDKLTERRRHGARRADSRSGAHRPAAGPPAVWQAGRKTAAQAACH